MKERAPLPGRLPEAAFLQAVGFWFVSFEEAKAHAPRIEKFKKKDLVGMRRHRRTDGEVTDAYELTDKGLERLHELAGNEVADAARGHREYLRAQARKEGIG